jgi:uncharacterized OB-fold protein
MIEEGYDRDHPYRTGVVRLVEGPTIAGQILGSDELDGLRIGTPVDAAFIERANGNTQQTALAFKRKQE